jgi:hypothetical protein
MIKRTLAKSALRSQWDFEVAQEICARTTPRLPIARIATSPAGLSKS